MPWICGPPFNFFSLCDFTLRGRAGLWIWRRFSRFISWVWVSIQTTSGQSTAICCYETELFIKYTWSLVIFQVPSLIALCAGNAPKYYNHFIINLRETLGQLQLHQVVANARTYCKYKIVNKQALKCF